jgi:hypothetical protein
MIFDVIDAKHIDDYNLKITFENGRKGIVDFSEFAKNGGVFNRFKKKNYFLKFFVNKDLGTICWPGGVDIAPETLYKKIGKQS